MSDGLPQHQLYAVRKLVSQTPDKTLRVLYTALNASQDQDPLMAHVKAIITTERKFRGVREIVFSPLLPLFRPDTEQEKPSVFPVTVLNLVWAKIGETEPKLVAEAITIAEDLKPQDYPPTVFDRLCRAAAHLLRDDPLAYSPDLPRLSEALAGYLDIIAPIRRAAMRLEDFVQKPTPENQAAFRVMVNEAIKISPTAAFDMLKVLQGNLVEKSDVLKLMVLVSDRKNENFMSESEFAIFGEELLDLAEERLHYLTGLETRGSHKLPADTRPLMSQIVKCCVTFEQAMEMTPTGPWGGRVADIRRRLVGFVEWLMRTLDKLLDRAMPGSLVRVGQSHKIRPDLTAEVDPKTIELAVDYMRTLRDLKPSAASVGFLSAYNNYMNEVRPKIEYFGDSSVEEIKTGDIEEAKLRKFIKNSVDLLEASGDNDTAQNLRRRGFSAKREENSKNIKKI